MTKRLPIYLSKQEAIDLRIAASIGKRQYDSVVSDDLIEALLDLQEELTLADAE